MINEVSKDSLFIIINIFEKLNIKYAIEGGWGIDILYGKQTREHHDLDVDIDKNDFEKLKEYLLSIGFTSLIDELPTRMEFYHQKYGFLDVHPLKFQANGNAIQVVPSRDEFEFKKEWFVKAYFEGKEIVCFSIDAQILFHQGYKLRTVDQHDLRLLSKMKRRT